MTKQTLIVFDIDGTLTDSVKIHQESFVKSLIDIGVEHIDKNFKAYKHHTDSYIAKTIFEQDRKIPFSTAKINEFENLLLTYIESSDISEINGVSRLLKNLENNPDIAICFATGSLLKPAKYKLNSIGINYSTQQLVASNQIFEREQIVLKAIENAKKFYHVNDFKRIISVGDGLWDLKTAQNLGIEFIGIGNTHKELLFENGMQRHFEDLTMFEIV